MSCGTSVSGTIPLPSKDRPAGGEVAPRRQPERANGRAAVSSAHQLNLRLAGRRAGRKYFSSAAQIRTRSPQLLKGIAVADAGFSTGSVVEKAKMTQSAATKVMVGW